MNKPETQKYVRSLQDEIKELKNQVSELEEECENKQKRIKDLEKSMKLFSMLNSIEKSGLYKDSVETYINSKISIKDTEIKVLREKICELEDLHKRERAVIDNLYCRCSKRAEVPFRDRRYACLRITTIDELNDKISDLESELSVKENLLKIRNSVNECQDAAGFLFHSEPISVAEQLINANYERKLSDLEKSLRKVTGCDCETTIETVYSVSDLRQIAEHLLVYCNHNSEGDGE